MIPTVTQGLLGTVPIALVVGALAVWGNWRLVKVWSWTFAIAKLVEVLTLAAFVITAVQVLGLGWGAVILVAAVANLVAARFRPWPGQVPVVRAEPTKNWTEDNLP